MEKNDKLIIVGIKIKNYKSFREFPKNGFLPINNFTTIIGRNDIGKSNLLKALKVFLRNENISKKDFHKYNTEDSCEITLRFHVPNSKKNGKIKEYTNNKGYIELTKQFIFNEGKIQNKYFLNDELINKKAFEKLRLLFPEPLFIPAIKDPEDEIKFQKGTIISELLLPIIEESSEKKEGAKTVKQLIENLTKLINEKSNRITSELLEISEQFWEDVEDINIRLEGFKLQKAFTPKVKIKDRYLKNEIDLIDRGNGFQRYFILSFLEVYRRRKLGEGFILLFEEPEIYLHFGAQKKLVNILKDFSGKGQVIITTHSPIFVNKSSIESTHLFYKENGETKVRYVKNDIRPILEELEFTPSDVFLSDYLIFVEGPTEMKLFRYLFDNLKRFEDYNVSFLHMGGGNNVSHFIERDLNSLHKINPNIAIILDGDKYEGYKGKIEEFDNKRLFLTFTKKNGKRVKEIENLFSGNAIKQIFGIEMKIHNWTNVAKTIQERGKNYNKTKDGKNIIKWMIEQNDPNVRCFEELFEEIFNYFKGRWKNDSKT